MGGVCEDGAGESGDLWKDVSESPSTLPVHIGGESGRVPGQSSLTTRNRVQSSNHLLAVVVSCCVTLDAFTTRDFRFLVSALAKWNGRGTLLLFRLIQRCERWCKIVEVLDPSYKLLSQVEPLQLRGSVRRRTQLPLLQEILHTGGRQARRSRR